MLVEIGDGLDVMSLKVGFGDRVDPGADKLT